MRYHKNKEKARGHKLKNENGYCHKLKEKYKKMNINVNIPRYTDLAKAYRQIQAENTKVKEVMQQTQDKALRWGREREAGCMIDYFIS